LTLPRCRPVKKRTIHWKGDALFAWLLSGAATADPAAAARTIKWLNLISQLLVDLLIGKANLASKVIYSQILELIT
jgi:hypothetical protein